MSFNAPKKLSFILRPRKSANFFAQPLPAHRQITHNIYMSPGADKLYI